MEFVWYAERWKACFQFLIGCTICHARAYCIPPIYGQNAEYDKGACCTEMFFKKNFF